mgnify:CR=1 FL=1
MSLRRGRFSKPDREYVAANHSTVSVEDMASHLQRSVKAVQKAVDAVTVWSVESNTQEVASA